VRELDERLGLSELIWRHLSDSRRGKNIQLPLADLLRQSICSRLGGMRMSTTPSASPKIHLPTHRLQKVCERGAALISRLQSFETELLTEVENLAGLAPLNRELIARAEAIDLPRRLVLDMDSTEVPAYGVQEQTAYNGHFESTCHHPQLLFNRRMRLPGGGTAPGNVHSAESLVCFPSILVLDYPQHWWRPPSTRHPPGGA